MKDEFGRPERAFGLALLGPCQSSTTAAGEKKLVGWRKRSVNKTIVYVVRFLCNEEHVQSFVMEFGTLKLHRSEVGQTSGAGAVAVAVAAAEPSRAAALRPRCEVPVRVWNNNLY